MKPLHRGLLVGLLQCVLVLSVAGKYSWDRDRLPRVWVQATPIDPFLPIRGRYVSLRLVVDLPAETPPSYWLPASLSVVSQRLVAQLDPRGSVRISRTREQAPWTLAEPAAFFIPDHVADPSQRAFGEELWVEVSVPESGPPRPVRLAVKKDGVMTPLKLE